MQSVAALVTGVFLGMSAMYILRHESSGEAKSHRSSEGASTFKAPTRKDEDFQEIITEQFSRNTAFFGEASQSQIRKSFVVVIGVGGVGSHAAHMLARSGVERLRLIDFDMITVSSLNRHACATYEDVGIPKVIALKNFFSKFAPLCEVDALKQMCDAENVASQLSGNPDYVLDCIDDITTKATLVAYCKEHNIKILSAMGAGAKADPTRLRIGDLTDCLVDKLASKLRWRLEKMGAIPKADKKEEDLDIGVKVIYSMEKPLVGLVKLDEDQANNPSEYGAVENMRLRTIPVLGTMPAIMGQSMAAFVLMELGGKPIKCMATDTMSDALKVKMLNLLKKREREVFGVMHDSSPLCEEDINVIVTEIWRSRSAISGVRQGRARMSLTRWDKNFPATIGNCVLLTDGEADTHDSSPDLTYLSPGVRSKIESTLAEVSAWYV